MALTQTKVHKGITITSAYHRIGTTYLNKQADGTIVVNYWVESKKDAGCENYSVYDTSEFKFIFDIDGDNIIKQCYTHLKTLSDFTGALDS